MEFVFITVCIVCTNALAKFLVSRGFSAWTAAQIGFAITLVPLVLLALTKARGGAEPISGLEFAIVFLLCPVVVALKCKLEADRHNRRGSDKIT